MAGTPGVGGPAARETDSFGTGRASSGGGARWTVRSALEWTRDFLSDKGDEHPRLSAEWLLCAATGLTRVELYMNYDRPLQPDELSVLHAGVVRRAKGEPLQYVTGEMPFRHIVLRCAPGVLIPRPETEVLVDEVLAYIAALPARDALPPFPAAAPAAPAAPGPSVSSSLGEEAVLQTFGEDATAEELASLGGVDPQRPPRPSPDVDVLEVGTGTGCIALSLAQESDRARVTATDLSPEAVSLALRNRDALFLQDRVRVVECDLASGVREASRGAFDVLVSNPPYIPTALLDTLPREVGDFEPALALDGGADGLDVFRRLVDLGTRALRPGGLLACELHEDCLEAAAALPTVRAHYRDVRIVRDLTGRNRHILARLEGGAADGR